MRSKKFRFILIIIGVLYALTFITSSSVFTCNKGACEVQNKNALNMTLSKYSVPIDNIKSFECRRGLDSVSGRRHYKRYYVYANLKDGHAYKIFAASRNYRSDAIINELNNVLKNPKKDNVYIRY